MGADIYLQCFGEIGVQERCHGFWRRETHGDDRGNRRLEISSGSFFLLRHFFDF